MLSIVILNASNQLLHQQVLSAAQSLHLDIILLNPNISTSIIRIAGKRKDLEVIELILNAIFSQQIGCKVEPLSQTSLSHQVIPADNWSLYKFCQVNRVRQCECFLALVSNILSCVCLVRFPFAWILIFASEWIDGCRVQRQVSDIDDEEGRHADWSSCANSTWQCCHKQWRWHEVKPFIIRTS